LTEIVLVLGKFDKNRTRNENAVMDTSLNVNKTGLKLTLMRVYYSRCYWPSKVSSLSEVWTIFQIWGRSDKNCGRYRGQ